VVDHGRVPLSQEHRHVHPEARPHHRRRGALIISTAGAGAASSDTATSVLDELCEQRGGLPVWSPYSIARCQGARANKGFDTERLVCESLADGRLTVTLSATHMNRASWGCFATAPAP